MPGFDENPFGEPTIDNPFAVRLHYVKLRWLSFTYVCIFYDFYHVTDTRERKWFEGGNHKPILFRRILLFSKLPQIPPMFRGD